MVIFRRSTGDVFSIKLNKTDKTARMVSMKLNGKFSFAPSANVSDRKGRFIKVIGDDDYSIPPGDLEIMYWDEFTLDLEVQYALGVFGSPACFAACNSALTSMLPFCNGFPPPIRQECLAAVYATYGWCMIGCLPT